MSKVRINITIDKSLHDELKKIGVENCRSVSQEVVYRLTHPTTSVSAPTPAPTTPTPVTPAYTHKPITPVQPVQPPQLPPLPQPRPGQYPSVWLTEQGIDPSDISQPTFKLFSRAYPQKDYADFVEIQTNRRLAYRPDATDPYDPMTNNPYNR